MGRLVESVAPERWPPIGAHTREAVARVLDRGVLSGAEAPEVSALEREFASWLGGGHAVATGSGTAALIAAMLALNLASGGEVVVPAYTFGATALAVRWAGLTPVFADVSTRTWNLDPAAVGRAIGANTVAIIAVHMHGHPCDMSALREIARAHGLPLIEDAAQAHGATWRGQRVGRLGDIACFSFQSSKHIGIGEGGLVATDDASLAARVRRICSFGMDMGPLAREDGGWLSLREHRELGSMFRLQELPAAIARSQLPAIEARIEHGRTETRALLDGLAGADALVLPTEAAEARHVWHKIRVGVRPRPGEPLLSTASRAEALRDALAVRGVETTRWQLPILPLHDLFRRESEVERWRSSALHAAVEASFMLFHEDRPLIAQAPGTGARAAACVLDALAELSRATGAWAGWGGR